MAVSDADRAQFVEDGWCLLPEVLSVELRDLLLEECAAAIADTDAEMTRSGTDVIGGSRRRLQYFPGDRHLTRPALRRFVTGAFMHSIARRLIGDPVHLFWEQFAIKLGDPGGGNAARFTPDDGPQSLGTFSWHQDSGYIPFDHDPYLSCWVALDDVTVDKGAVRLIPYGEIGVRTRVAHVPAPGNGDLVGYFGTASGVMPRVPARSILCFASTTFHTSAPNRTGEPRRAYLAQYSQGIIRKAPDAEPWSGSSPMETAAVDA